MNKPQLRPWYLRIGPGLITACVVIGPGSVLTSSKVGAKYGFAMNWIVVVSVVFMIAYVGLGAKLGAVTRVSPGTLVTQRAGRWLAVLIGLSVFVISALFQFGNNMGVQAALDAYLPAQYTLFETGEWRLYIDFGYSVVVFNALTLAFLFGFKNLYKALERLMMAFVALMLISFAANLILAGPNVVDLLAGFIPRWSNDIDISLLGLVGTTFVISAAFLQPYLVQQKGWGKDDVKQGLVDARVGGVIMALITLMIVSTSATVFHQPQREGEAPAEPTETSGTESRLEPRPPNAPVQLENVSDVARQLQHLLGNWSQFVFCLGLFSAAYSSFLVNSMIGGFILSDGLGLGSDPHERGPRICTAIVLMVGMVVALLVMRAGFNPVGAIVTAQALTVLAAPLLAGVLLWLTNLPSIMGEDRNRWPVNVIAALGLAMLLVLSGYTAIFKVAPPEVRDWLFPPPAAASDEESQGAVDFQD